MIVSLDDNGLKLGNPPQLVPGFCTSVSVGSKLIFDTGRTEGTNGQKYQLKGWEDGDISVGIRILDDDENPMETQLAQVVDLFKKSDETGAPIVYEIDMPIVRAWRITKTFFIGLQTDFQAGKLEYKGALKFREWKPEIDVIQENKEAQQEESESYPSLELTSIYNDQDIKEYQELKRQVIQGGGNV